MTYIYIIWGLILLATLALILSVSYVKSYLIKHQADRSYFIANHYLNKYISIITIFTILLWWIAVTVYSYVLNIMDFEFAYIIMILTLAIVSGIVCIIFFLKAKSLKKDFDFKEIRKSNLSVLNSLMFIIALIYAMMINYGIQILIVCF